MADSNIYSKLARILINDSYVTEEKEANNEILFQDYGYYHTSGFLKLYLHWSWSISTALPLEIEK